MLILTRKRGEQIVIGNDITVTVMELRGSAVRLGIDAPKELPAHRREVFDRLREEEERDGK